MKNTKYILLLLFVIVMFSCKKDKLTLQSNYLGNEITGAPTPLDDSLYNEFTKIYNIGVVYKWDQSLYPEQYALVPPQESLVTPFMNMVKRVWIDPYNAQTGSTTFMQMYTPKQIVLSGSPELNSNGTEVLGVAEGGLSILLTSVNNDDLTDFNTVQQVAHVINHEFTHILNQKKAYPVAWTQITPSGYTGGWAVDPTDPQTIGFISAYARDSPFEDFAETTSLMLVWGKTAYESYVAGAPASSAALLRQKEAMVVTYFKTQYNIDFYSLQAKIFASL